MVEAVRAGTIFAEDRKSYQRWRSKAVNRKQDRRTIAENLETAIRGLAVRHPEYVVVGAKGAV